jgi:hypothetical protein
MQEGQCAKCKKFTIIEEHHPLPKSIFGGIGGTIKLCPTCHRLYHQYLGQEGMKNKDMVFHLYTFEKWMAGLAVLVAVVSVLLVIWIGK